MTYEGTHRPLAAYTKALTAAGLVIETIREPANDHAGQLTAPFLDLLARRQLLPGLSRLQAVGALPRVDREEGSCRDLGAKSTTLPGALAPSYLPVIDHATRRRAPAGDTPRPVPSGCQ